MHKHTLTFEGDAIDGLRAALAEAGHPHTVESKITKPKVTREPRKAKAPVRQAAE